MMNGGSEKLGIFLMKRQHQAAFFSFHFAAFYFNFAARAPTTHSLSRSATFSAHPTRKLREARMRDGSTLGD